ncbi:MAG TPA: TlpA disulfide reductase family protein [Anaeromyxobacteraceae bacterium]|nr:TlpA disulfide reductase family protein [Anaeromyxobacteraceae bacterium]
MRLSLAAALALALAARAVPADDEVAVGQPAPAFSLKTLNPEVARSAWIALDRYVGDEAADPGAKLVVISFFASWCVPCQKELPALEQLHRTYADQGLRVLGVDVDREEAGIAAARKLLEAHRVTYPVLSDRFNLLARRYLGAQAPLPSLFVVRRDGTVARIERGYAKDVSAVLLAEIQGGLGLRAQAAKAGARP